SIAPTTSGLAHLARVRHHDQYETLVSDRARASYAQARCSSNMENAAAIYGVTLAPTEVRTDQGARPARQWRARVDLQVTAGYSDGGDPGGRPRPLDRRSGAARQGVARDGLPLLSEPQRPGHQRGGRFAGSRAPARSRRTRWPRPRARRLQDDLSAL